MDIPTPNPAHQDPTGPGGNRSQVIGDPVIAYSTGSLSFVATPGGQSPGQALTIGNNGTGVLSWRLTTSAPWIRLSRAQGVALGSDLGKRDQTITVVADASSLLPGTHTGTINIESLYGAGSGASIRVTVQTADGALMGTPDGRVYVLVGGIKRYIPDTATFEANGYSASKIVGVPADWAASVPTGQPLPSVLGDGRLLRPPGDSVPIFVMESGAKRQIVDGGWFRQCGYGWDAVKTISAATIDAIPNGPGLTTSPCPRPSFANGTLLRGSDGKVWVVQFGGRRGINTATTFANCGYQWGNLNDLGDSTNAQLPISPELFGCTGEGSLLWTQDGALKVVVGGQLRHIPDPLTFELAGFGWGNVAPAGTIGLPIGEPVISLATSGILLRPPGANVPIYVLDGGGKRHITSPGVMDKCGYSWTAIATVSSSIVSGIPNGPPLEAAPCPSLQFPLGTLLRDPDGAVWVAYGHARKWVRTFGAFADCGYQVGKISVAGSAVLTALFAAPPVSGCTNSNTPVVTSEGKVYIVVSGWKRHVPSPATADALGLSWASLIPIPDGWLPTAKPLLDIAATGRLVRPPGDNVPIYVMDGDAKRHITSPAALAACGYGWDAVFTLPATTVVGFPEGPALSAAPCPHATFANGTLLLGVEGKVWAVESGQRRWVVDSGVFTACGYHAFEIDRIADSIIAALPQGPNLGNPPCP